MFFCDSVKLIVYCNALTSNMEATLKLPYEAPTVEVVEIKPDAYLLQSSLTDYPYHEIP